MIKITKFQDVPSFTRRAGYNIHVPWSFLKDQLKQWMEERETALLDLSPDFQREHVWNWQQQIAYIEYALKGGVSGKDIYFNCAGWMQDFRGPFVLVDGKQRISAVLAFLNNLIPVFGSFYSEYTDRLHATDTCFNFHVNNLKSRAEVLQWYIDMNVGGTPHSAEEIAKVEILIDKEKNIKG